MSGKSWLAVLGLSLLVGLVAWAAWSWWRSAEESLAPLAVPRGDQEVAWLMPATSLPVWDRFLEAVEVLSRNANSGLVWETDRAISRGHRDIPELALRQRGGLGRLWIRWYKLTGDYTTEHWLRNLLQRRPRPLVVIGGSTSDRAVELVRLLSQYHERAPDTPALLLTTATTDEIEPFPGAGLTDLLALYPGRTFRFCFTNRQMAEALADFISGRPAWLPSQRIWDAITWRDDPYSQDLANRFSDALRTRELGWLRKSVVPYSVGGALLPSERERQVIEEDLIATWAQEIQSAHVLLLPTAERVARRVLVGIVQAAPWSTERLTVVVGDSISFNVLCRDRRLLWPTELLPVRLLLFSHENPLHWTGTVRRLSAEVALAVLEGGALVQGVLPVGASGIALPVGRQAGTDDLLLWVRILRAVQHAAWITPRPDAHFSLSANSAVLVSDPQQFSVRLKDYRDELGEAFFDDSGNRRLGAGEYVIVLEVWRPANRLATWSVLEIWHSQRGDHNQRRWQSRCRWLMHSDY